MMVSVSTLPVETDRLRRDRYTVTLYGTFVMWGWFLYSFNPSVSLLGEDLGISKAVAGLHGTAIAVGAITAALLTPWLVRARGRRTVIIAGLLLVGGGIALLLLVPHVAATLAGCFVVSVGGNVTISTVQVALSVHHGPAASAAITEANGAGSGIGLFGPLAVGACVGLGWGWRPAVAVTTVLAVAVAVAVSRLPHDRSDVVAVPAASPRAASPDATASEVVGQGGQSEERTGRRTPLAPGSGWFLGAIVAAVALENATTYWSTSLVREQTGAGADIAAATAAGLIAGMTIIRFVVGPLTLRLSTAHLLAASFGVAIVGWAVLWTATSPTVAIVGLFVAGLGYGAQYPLSIALLLAVAGGAGDRAQAAATFAGGVAVGIAPFLLGAAADAVGAHTAFLAVPVVAVLGAVVALGGDRVVRRTTAAELGTTA